jgi:DNA-binding NarL/FixJ family response regulator
MPSTVAGHPAHGVAVVDKHESVHAAVQSWCAQERPQILFVRGYFSTEHFLAEHPSSTASPVRVVICDIQTASGRVDFTGSVALVEAGYRVIVYTHVEADDVVKASVERGAFTCLVKSEGKEHLIKAIRAAHTDTPYVGPRLGRAMLNEGAIRSPRLAPRERQVLIAWCLTDSKDEAAQQLSIAPTTVRTILQRIRAKYAAVGRPATTKAALVARAIQDGIIGVDDL